MGALVGALVSSGHLSGRHVGPFNLSWPEGGKRVDQTEPQNSHQLIIQTDTHLWVESTKQDPEGMSICEQHTCKTNSKTSSYTCMRLHPQFLSLQANHKHKQVFQSCWTEPNRSGNIEKSWVVTGTSLHCHVAERRNFFTMKPALHTPIFKKKC